jgi:hypothetical protein
MNGSAEDFEYSSGRLSRILSTSEAWGELVVMSRGASPVLKTTAEQPRLQITLVIGVFSRDNGYLLLATTSRHNPPHRSPRQCLPMSVLGLEESGYDSCVNTRGIKHFWKALTESRSVQLKFSLANKSTIPRQAHQWNVWVSNRNVDAAPRRRRPLEGFTRTGTEPDRFPPRTDGCWRPPSHRASRQCGEPAPRPH